MADPFTQIHDKLWQMVDEHTTLDSLVKPGNRIKLDENAPIKETLNRGDVPELILRPLGGSPNGPLIVNSHQWELTVRFDWVLTSGSYIIGDRLFPVTWQLLRLMALFQQQKGTLQWNSSSYVKGMTLTGWETGEQQPNHNRGLGGFASVLPFELLLRFSNDLIEEP